jgi:type I restriction enzyme S subunit
MKQVLVKLEDVVEFTNGGAWSDKEYVDSGIPVARITDFTNGTIDLRNCKFLPHSSFAKYKKHELKYGDLVIAMVGSHPVHPNSVVGRAVIVPKSAEGALLNQNAVRIKPRVDEIDKIYLGYLGQSDIFKNYIVAHARGAANQVRMSIGSLREMKIQLPPLPIQQKIGAILLANDELIENNRRRIAILEEIARSIYEEWFIKFHFPGYEKTQMVESSFGIFPEGWKITTLNAACEYISRGVTPKYMQGTSRFIINQKVNQGSYLERNYLKELSFDVVVPPEKYAQQGDLLVNCLGEGTLGRVNYFNLNETSWAVDQHMTICRSNNVAFTNYAYFYLASNEGQKRIEALKTGGTNMTMFNISVLRSFKIILPPQSVLDSFYNLLKPIWMNIKLLNAKKNNLLKTRDLLLPKLIAGEVDVSHFPEPETI